MATDAAVKQFIAERQARLTPCFERGDVDQILTFYHKDLSFSDHGTHICLLVEPHFLRHLPNS